MRSRKFASLGNTQQTRLTNAGLMLGQRRRWWTNIKATLVSYVLAEYVGNNELGDMDLKCIHIIDIFTCFIHITIVHVTTICFVTMHMPTSGLHRL